MLLYVSPVIIVQPVENQRLSRLTWMLSVIVARCSISLYSIRRCVISSERCDGFFTFFFLFLINLC